MQAGAIVRQASGGRGAQLAEGAAVAEGDWLVFLHADTCLERGWAEAIRAVAAETETPLIDLNASSADLVQSLGPLDAARLSPGAPPPDFAPALLAGNTPPTPPAATPPVSAHGHHVDDFDYTHLGPDGAAVIAALVARDLIAVAPDLAPRLVP